MPDNSSRSSTFKFGATTRAVRGLAATALAVAMLAGPQAASARPKMVALLMSDSQELAGSDASNSGQLNQISSRLRAYGFDVVDVSNADMALMRGRLDDFSKSLAGADFAFFYYGGTGSAGANSGAARPEDAAKVGEVVDGLRKSKVKGAVFVDVVFDPAATGARLGAPIEAEGVDGQLVVVSSASAKTLGTGGADARLTAKLVSRLQRREIKVASLARDIESDVVAESFQAVVPWVAGSLPEDLSISEATGQESARAGELWQQIDAKFTAKKCSLDQLKSGQGKPDDQQIIELLSSGGAGSEIKLASLDIKPLEDFLSNLDRDDFCHSPAYPDATIVLRKKKVAVPARVPEPPPVRLVNVPRPHVLAAPPTAAAAPRLVVQPKAAPTQQIVRNAQPQVYLPPPPAP